jgi:RNA polymerase sigma factor (sigma-70 family)
MPDPGPSPEEAFMDTENARALRVCLNELPALQRQALVLAYQYALTHPEVAQQLRQPLGTTKTWIRRGLVRLRVCMEQSGH